MPEQSDRWNDYGRGDSQTAFFRDAAKRAKEAADKREAPQVGYDGFYTMYATGQEIN